MKSFSIHRLLILLMAVCFAVSSCTLIDNDLRPEEERQSAAAADSTGLIEQTGDGYTATYRYSSETRVIDNQMLTYVAGVDYTTGTLYLEDFTPDALLPRAGEILAGPVCEKLPYGLAHRVIGVSHLGTFYDVRIQRAAIDEVFDSLELDGDLGSDPDSPSDDDEDYAASRTTRAVYNKDFALPTANFEQKVNLGMTFGEAFQLSGSGDLTFGLKVKPIVKAYVYINKEKKKYDIRLKIGSTVTAGIDFEANGTFTIDVLELLELKDLMSIDVPIGEVVGLPLFISIYPEVLINGSVSGKASVEATKTFYTSVRATRNISGIDDGLHVSNHQEPVQFVENVIPDDDVSGSASISFDAGIDFGATADVSFSAAGEEPKVGIKFSLLLGPHFSTKFSTEIEGYDRGWHFGVPLTLSGKVYIDIFKGLPPLEVDFIKYLTSKWGGSNTLWEFAKIDYRFYPSIDNMRIQCTNRDETGPPRFSVDFDVLKSGTKVGKLIGFRPIFRIFRHNVSSAVPIAEYDPFKYTTYRDGLSFNYVINEPSLKRDEIYDLEVAMVKPYMNKEDVMFTRRYPFTSTSPSAFINFWKKTAQWKHMCKQMRNGGYSTYYDYDFITYVHFNGREKIKRWGFKVNGEDFKIQNPPVKDDLAVRWSITKSNKSSRTVKIVPYIVYDLEGHETTINQAPYTVALEFETSRNTVVRQDEGRIYRADGDHDDYVRTGFDDNENNVADVDMALK